MVAAPPALGAGVASPSSPNSEATFENPEVPSISDCGTEQEDATPAAAARPRDGMKRCVRRWCTYLLFALIPLFLAVSGTAVELTILGMLSHRGGVVMVAAMTATRSIMTAAGSLLSFIFLGGMSLIGSALGEGDDLKAGRFARLSVALAVIVGLAASVLLQVFAEPVLGIYHQQEVAGLALGLYRRMVATFPVSVLAVTLNGLLLGFLYVHVVMANFALSSLVSVALFYPLFAATDLGLNAFAISLGGTMGCSVLLSVAYLLHSSRRRKFGLRLGLGGFSRADLHSLAVSMGCLAFRSFNSQVPIMLSTMWAMRLSPTCSAVFALLMTKSSLIERVAGGLSLMLNFIGVRLWAAKYHGAFWNLLLFFSGCICTPFAVVVVATELMKGRESLTETFARTSERAAFDEVMTSTTFKVFVLLTIARSYYGLLEQTMIALQAYWQLTVIQVLSFVAHFGVSYAGYRAGDFTVLLSGMLVWVLVRTLGGLVVVGTTLREHPLESYATGTNTDPGYALRLTVDDPAVILSWGQLRPGKARGSKGEESKEEQMVAV